MAKRLAVTVAGAVSLGSFEAGVMYEVINAIKQHNQDPRTAPADRIEIDVLTGASAGGMTAAVAAHKLLFSAASLEDPYGNSLYQPWVVDVSIAGLLALQQGEDPTHSILSSAVVDGISREHITDRYTAGVPSIDKHPASAAVIKLGLAMSNLNGVDYRHPLRPAGDFVYTRYQDQCRVDLSSNSQSDTLAVWEPIRRAAVSCGAFPFAFRPREIPRPQKDFPDPNVVPFSQDPSPFTYTDGGVFQNEPLGLAKDLVDEIDAHQDVESRFYLFVSPEARASTANARFSEAIADFKVTVQQLFAAIFQQSRFHDWITAESVNDKIEIFNARAAQLQQALITGTVNDAEIQQTARALLRLLFNPTSAFGETQPQAEQRLKNQFAQEYAALSAGKSAAVADDWIDAILVLETAADLGMRDEMTIYALTAEGKELASSEVMAFAGFFDQRYRDHDYDVGRTKAQAFLTGHQVSGPGQIGPLHYTPEPIRQIDHSLDGLQLSNIPQQVRQQLKGRLEDRAQELLKELDVPWIVRKPVGWWLVSPQLKKLLSL